MAQVRGSAGSFTSNEAVRKARRNIAVTLIVMAIIGLVEGYLFAVFLHKIYLPIIGLVLLSICGYFLFKHADKYMEQLEKEKINFRKGAVGEYLVAGLLERDLSNNFYVINDLSTPHGDIDHVVVGPTGIFLIDTKNWRGAVKADDKGELLLNNKPINKPEIKNFQVRVMEIRNRFLSLCNLDDIYFQPIFVFPTAWVDPTWGSTRNVCCMTYEKLIEYIENQKPPKNFMSSSMAQYVTAFEALGRFDKKL